MGEGGGRRNSTYFDKFLLSFQEQHNTLVGKGIRVQILFQEDLLFLFIQNSFYPKGRLPMGFPRWLFRALFLGLPPPRPQASFLFT